MRKSHRTSPSAVHGTYRCPPREKGRQPARSPPSSQPRRLRRRGSLPASVSRLSGGGGSTVQRHEQIVQVCKLSIQLWLLGKNVHFVHKVIEPYKFAGCE